MKIVCGIKHSIPDLVCIREYGHDGFCRCKASTGTGGTITYMEWQSKDGKFKRHVGYQTIYPANGQRSNLYK